MDALAAGRQESGELRRQIEEMSARHTAELDGELRQRKAVTKMLLDEQRRRREAEEIVARIILRK